MLSKLFDSTAGVVKVGIGFGKTEANESMSLGAGEEGLARHPGHPCCANNVATNGDVNITSSRSGTVFAQRGTILPDTRTKHPSSALA